MKGKKQRRAERRAAHRAAERERTESVPAEDTISPSKVTFRPVVTMKEGKIVTSQPEAPSGG